MRSTSLRYQIPSNKEPAPYCNVCQVVQSYGDKGKERTTYYIQTSANEKEPKWVLMGDFLEKVFISKFEDESFIDECMKLFKT